MLDKQDNALLQKRINDLSANPFEPSEVIKELKLTPDSDLVKVKDEKYGATLLLIAIFKLSRTPKDEKKQREGYIELINYIIEKTPFDLRAANEAGSTALHQVFWYANRDPAFQTQWLSLGSR